jgi:hypothetical protein
MRGIDFQNSFGEYLLDEHRKIPYAHLCKVCQKDKRGACRYMALTVIGFVCVKKALPLKKMIDKKVKENRFHAVGDNCEGLGSIE